MKLTRSNNKIVVDYIAVVLIILFSSRANPLFRDPRYLLIPLIFCIYHVRKRRIHFFTNGVVKTYLFYFYLILAYLVKYKGEFDPMFTYKYFIYITLAILIFKLVGYRFYKIFVDVMYRLSILSLPLYFFRFFYEEQILRIFKNIEVILNSVFFIPFYDNPRYGNIILYTINPNQWRNCGFAWEPGPFATYIILAIYFFLIQNDFNLKDKKVLIFTLALATTFSTTGYLAFSILVLWFFLNKKTRFKPLLFPVILLFFIYLSTLPFMQKKILKLISAPKNVLEKSIERSYLGNKVTTLGRFAALLSEWETLKLHPFIGYGGHSEELWYRKLDISVKISSVNGIAEWMSKFGIFGITILMISYYLSIVKIKEYYGYEYNFWVFVLFFVLFFSFNLIMTPFFFAIQFSFVSLPKIKKEKLL